MKNRPFRQRLGFAVAGLRECWRSESSFRSHVMLGGMAIGGLILFRPEPIWWALVGLAIALVLALEAVNSAFERLIDHLHPERHPEIGFAKDMAAGGVLLISVGSLVVAAALVVSLF